MVGYAVRGNDEEDTAFFNISVDRFRIISVQAKLLVTHEVLASIHLNSIQHFQSAFKLFDAKRKV